MSGKKATRHGLGISGISLTALMDWATRGSLISVEAGRDKKRGDSA